MKSIPYIIWSHPYFHGSAGVRVLHRLGHLLNQAGYQAYMYDCPTNPRWNISSISRKEGQRLIDQGAIVVYPEVVKGNPLMGKTVVRYLLNTPGLLGGEKTYHPDELLFSYSKIHLQPGMSEKQILAIPVVDTSIFYNPRTERDIDFLVYIGRHKNVGGYPEKLKIYRHKPSRQEEVGALLRRAKKLISYDSFSVLNFEATLCGTPVVIIPDGSRRKEDLAAGEFGLNGIAWGESAEEWARAQATLPKVPAVLARLEKEQAEQLKLFIDQTQARAREKLAYRRGKKSVSLIIPSFNGLPALKNNLPKLIRYLPGGLDCELIVVDNGSSDGTAEYLKANFPQIKVVISPSPLGFARACNLGAAASSKDLLYFINNDVEPAASFLDPLLKHFENELVFGVTPKVIRPSQNNLVESFITGSFQGGVISAVFDLPQKYAIPGHASETFSLCGAAMLIEKEKFNELGGLDEAFSPFYYEETDLSYRALKRGWKLIFDPAALVYHQHNQTIGKNYSDDFARWSYRKNQYLAVWKNIGDPVMLLKNIFQMVIPKLIVPNLTEWKALASALFQLPGVLLKRKKLYRLSDREVFRAARRQLDSLKFHSKIKNIVVIRPDAIGDLTLTLPAIHALKEEFPSSQITALIRDYTRPVLENDPAVDKIKTDFSFAEEQYDLSVNFFNQAADSFALWNAGIPYRVGDSARILTGWLNNLRVFRRWSDLTRHEVDFNLDLLAPLGIKGVNQKPVINPDPKAKEKINLRLKENRIGENDRLAVMHISGGKSHNVAWNNLGYSEVADWLMGKKGMKVVFAGGEDAAEKGQKIAALCHRPPINLVGEINLAELIALIAKCEFYIGTDTGPTHLAAMLNKPLVALFLSKWAKPLRWGPWKTRHLVVKNFSRCQKVCQPPACSEPICSNEIDAKTVIAAGEIILAGGGVTGEEETFTHWAQRSFSIGLVFNEEARARAETIQSLLQAAGYNAYLIEARGTMNLLRSFIARDTNIIHHLGSGKNLPLLAAQQLSGAYLSNRALLINDAGKEYADARDLIDLYVNRFRGLRF